jgi:hypothetical protein
VSRAFLRMRIAPLGASARATRRLLESCPISFAASLAQDDNEKRRRARGRAEKESKRESLVAALCRDDNENRSDRREEAREKNI